MGSCARLDFSRLPISCKPFVFSSGTKAAPECVSSPFAKGGPLSVAQGQWVPRNSPYTLARSKGEKAALLGRDRQGDKSCGQRRRRDSNPQICRTLMLNSLSKPTFASRFTWGLRGKLQFRPEAIFWGFRPLLPQLLVVLALQGPFCRAKVLFEAAEHRYAGLGWHAIE